MYLQRKWDLEDRQYAIDHPTVIKNEVDYDEMVKSAEAAGINPLTALRNGGSAGFSLSSQPAAPLSRQAPVKEAPHQQATAGLYGGGGGSALGSLGESLQSVGNNWLANFDPFQDQKREAEYQLVQAQIRNLNASTGNLRSQSFNVPAHGSGSFARSGTRSKTGALSSSAKLGSPAAPSAGGVSVTNPWKSAVVDPTVRDAQAFEARYGDSEVFSMLYGGAVGVSDLWANVKKDAKGTRDLWSSRWRRLTGAPLTKMPSYGKPYTTNPIFQ